MLRDFSLRDFGASLNTAESYTNESSQGKIGLCETVNKQKCTHLGMFLASERIHFKYFDVELKKKGTVHIWFTNEELLKKFNIFGCQKHGWLPNGYGKKSYKDMTKEEQDVIDSFEGKSSYENVMSNPQIYLGGNQMLQLMG